VASGTGKQGSPGWAKWAVIAAGVALIAGVLAISGMAVAAAGPVAPEPPTDVRVAVTPGPSEQIAFAPPLNDGGDPISGYSATCTSEDGGAARTAAGAGSPITVSGLSYGRTYTCVVIATNDHGDSVPSAESNAFVPITVPSAPRPVTAVPYGPATAKVIWSPPETDGGSKVTAFKITPYLGSTAQNVRTYNSPATTQLVNGLITGRSYTFTIAAVNGAGTGPFSVKTHPVTMGTPGQPQDVKAAKSSSGAIRVTYQAPGNNGATITTYTAGCNSTDGGVNRTRTINAPPAAITVNSLTAGKTYRCAVKATNNRGSGPRSSQTPEVKA
jgi:hypothetical protein